MHLLHKLILISLFKEDFMKAKRRIISALMFIFILVIVIGCGGSKKTAVTDIKEESAERSRVDSGDLLASMANLPGLAEPPGKGGFVELVKSLDEVYTDGTITIEIYPFSRSVQNVIDGKVDFHVPTLRNPVISEEKLPYRTVTESMGIVVFVCYSNIDNIITRKEIMEARDKGGKFPYVIDAPGGLEGNFTIPVIPSNDLSVSFQKLQNKRIDAVLWAQEESDLTVRELKLNKIYRSHYADFEDAIIIPKGPEGEKTDKILSKALKKIKASGRQQELYKDIHVPYQDWQPSKMGW
jgi:polar amino acid transport system substrate-binding protein